MNGRRFSTLLVASIGLVSGLAHAQSYEFRHQVNGLSASDPLDVSWEEFAKENNLPFDPGWNSFDWSNQGLTGLPTTPYPNPRPSGVINLDGNDLQSLGGLSILESVYKIHARYNDIPNLDEFSNLTSIASGGALDFRNNGMVDVSGVSGVSGAHVSLLFQYNDLKDLDAFYRIPSLRSVDFRSNPNLTDLSGLNGAGSLGSYAYFDSDIDSRQGLVKMSPGSGICQAYNWQIRNVVRSQICY